MNYSRLWAKTTLNKTLATDVLHRYGDFLKWKNDKCHVLEIGCGDGSLTNRILYPYIKDRVEKFVAIDKLQRMIDYARQHTELKNIDFQTMDIRNDEEVEKMKAKFDHVFSFHTAHWILDLRTFVSNVYKMLKPDGQMLMTCTPNTPFHESFHRNFGEKSWSKYLPHERVFSNYGNDPVGHIKKVVEEVGFKVEVCELEERSKSIENFIDYSRSVISMHPHLDRIPSELQEDFFQTHLEYVIGKSVYLGEPNLYEIKFEDVTCIASK